MRKAVTWLLIALFLLPFGAPLFLQRGPFAFADGAYAVNDTKSFSGNTVTGFTGTATLKIDNTSLTPGGTVEIECTLSEPFSGSYPTASSAGATLTLETDKSEVAVCVSSISVQTNLPATTDNMNNKVTSLSKGTTFANASVAFPSGLTYIKMTVQLSDDFQNTPSFIITPKLNLQYMAFDMTTFQMVSKNETITFDSVEFTTPDKDPAASGSIRETWGDVVWNYGGTVDKIESADTISQVSAFASYANMSDDSEELPDGDYEVNPDTDVTNVPLFYALPRGGDRVSYKITPIEGYDVDQIWVDGAKLSSSDYSDAGDYYIWTGTAPERSLVVFFAYTLEISP